MMNKNWLPFLQKLADKSDPISLNFFALQEKKHHYKSDQTPVSQADMAIEEMVRTEVRDFSSEMSVFGEEFGHTNPQSDLKLIIDPIDGTSNFIRNIPFFATLLAIEKKGVITAGLISAPKTQERWWAVKNLGAFYNGKKMTVSSVDSLAKSQAFYGGLFGPEGVKVPPHLFDLLKKTYRQRGFGDYYAHMLVAMGSGEFALDFGVKPWDMAPIKIIMEEAGGAWSDSRGKASIYGDSMISSNGILHPEILRFF